MIFDIENWLWKSNFGKNLSNFVPLAWKLNNPYYHNRHEGLNESKDKAIVGHTDPGLYSGIGSEWECLTERLGKKCEENNECYPQCNNCVWQQKEFSMDRIFVETNDLDTGNKIDLQKFLGPPSPTWQGTVLSCFL